MFFKKTDPFQALFTQHIAISLEASTALQEAFVENYPMGAYEKVMHCEHEGDLITAKVYTLLTKTFITKLDKSDIERIIQELDNIVDSMKNVLSHAKAYHVAIPADESTAIARILAKMVRSLNSMVRDLPILTSINAHEYVGSLNTLEGEADDIRWQCMERLSDAIQTAISTESFTAFQHTQIEQNIWEKIVGELEQATDHCFHLSATLACVVRKEGR